MPVGTFQTSTLLVILTLRGHDVNDPSESLSKYGFDNQFYVASFLQEFET